MPRPVTILDTLERYYDTAPRAQATTEEVGPFTLFLKEGDGWDYYARPRLGLTEDITPADVAAVRARQRELGVAENIEWVHETTPSLLAAVRAGSPPTGSPPDAFPPTGSPPDGTSHAGLAPLPVEECPLLALPADPSPIQGFSRRVDEDVTAR